MMGRWHLFILKRDSDSKLKYVRAQVLSIDWLSTITCQKQYGSPPHQYLDPLSIFGRFIYSARSISLYWNISLSFRLQSDVSRVKSDQRDKRAVPPTKNMKSSVLGKVWWVYCIETEYVCSATQSVMVVSSRPQFSSFRSCVCDQRMISFCFKCAVSSESMSL